MSSLLLILAAVVVVWAMAFIGAPLLAWAAVAGAATLGLNQAGLIGHAATIAGAVVFGLLAFLCIVPLRRAVLSNFIFGAFKKVLPEMSSTEREALEAGDVWWEGEMFRGRPDWSKLLDFKYTKLTREEQSFLDNECEELCKMVDDWKVEFEDKDLPPAVWQYIKDQRFFAM